MEITIVNIKYDPAQFWAGFFVSAQQEEAKKRNQNHF